MIAPLATFLDVAQNVGLPIVFLLIAIETMGIPVPGETALITAGIVASRGHLSIEAVIAVAAARGDPGRQRRLRDRPQARPPRCSPRRGRCCITAAG